ncbi:MAG TPA: IS5 family transposase [Terracidiphilus sp.]|nr:IS5 family transposase [Terracidiphilus sp.]
MFAGDSVGAAHWSPVARSARGVSRRVHLLAAVADVGGARCLAASLEEAAGPDGPARTAGLGRSLSGRHLRHREKGGSGVGKTRRGKGTKCMVVVDGRGVPVGAQLASAQISEHQLAESTLATVNVPRTGRGRPRSRLRRVIADRGYDSDPLRERLKQRGTDLIVPYRSNNRQRRYEDGRKLRRYKRRWKIERTNAWLQNFRRIQVRYDRILTLFQGFFHFSCLLITLRHLCN